MIGSLFGPFGFFLSALLGLLAFPPIGLSPLGWIALIPFLTASRALAPSRALKWGYLGGLFFFGGALYWISYNTGAPPFLRIASAIATALLLASIWAIAAYFTAQSIKKHGLIWGSVVFVLCFSFLEVFWGTGELSFPWAIWALTQSSLLPFIQIADLVDTFGLSLWIFVINALAFLIWQLPQNRKVFVGVMVIIFLSNPIYGWIKLHNYKFGRKITAAAVQGNIPAMDKWEMDAEDILDIYLRESESLKNSKTDIIVWPETASPVALRYVYWAKTKIQNFCDSANAALITGATDYEGKSRYSDNPIPYNSAFFIRPKTQELLSSSKIHLVPFGERIPGQKMFPFLGKIHLGQAEFAPGKEAVVFPAWEELPKSGSLVCFEVTYPEVASELVLKGAQILTNITQDGWFQGSTELYQHLDLTRLRAVAANRSIIRSANSGISALILPTGEVIASLAPGKVGVVQGKLPIQSEISWAVKLHKIWLPFYAILLGVVLIYLRFKSRSV